MIRVVIDPGVLIAAVLTSDGPPAVLLRRWIAGAFEIVVSPKLLDELLRVLARPKFRSYLTLTEAEQYVALLGRWAERADDTAGERYTPDPDDDYLIALALSARADFIVSGDRHLTGWQDPKLPVLTPRQAVALLDELEDKKP